MVGQNIYGAGSHAVGGHDSDAYWFSYTDEDGRNPSPPRRRLVAFAAIIEAWPHLRTPPKLCNGPHIHAAVTHHLQFPFQSLQTC